MTSDDVRAKRADRLRRRQRAETPKKVAKWAIVVIVVVAGVALLGYAIMNAPAGPKFHHNHASFRIYVNDAHVSFNRAEFDIATTKTEAAHLHVLNGEADPGEAIHMEGTATPDRWGASADYILSAMNVELRAGHLRLSPVHGGTEFNDNETHNLKFRVAHEGGNFSDEPSFQNYFIRQGDRVLISFGPRGADLTAQQNSVIVPPSGTKPT